MEQGDAGIKNIGKYTVELLDGMLGKELHIGFPETDARSVVAVDVYRENGGNAPCMQVLVYAAGADEPGVAVRFNDDGCIAEVVHDPNLPAVPQGTTTRWQDERDGVEGRKHGTLVVGNVDLELLDEQRLALMRTVVALGNDGVNGDRYLLDGLLNMLDAWSDERAEASGEAVP
jgi:hypothetical protein